MSHPDGIDLAKLKPDDVLTKRRGLKRNLSARADLQPVRIAVLGGSTTNEVVDLLELWLLHDGLRPTFHQSEYGRFYVDAVHDTESLIQFKPDLVYVHTSILNIQQFPSVGCSNEDFDANVRAELDRFHQIWSSLEEKLGCVVIQNNFEHPPCPTPRQPRRRRSPGGQTRFVYHLNLAFARSRPSQPQAPHPGSLQYCRPSRTRSLVRPRPLVQLQDR